MFPEHSSPPLPSSFAHLLSMTPIGPPAQIGSIVSKLHCYNDLVAGVISVITITCLIFLITSKISTANLMFKRVMVLTASFEMFFSICYGFTAPIFTSITSSDYCGLLIINNSYLCDVPLLLLSILMLSQLIFISPWLSVFRYIQVCRKSGVRLLDVINVITLNLIFHFLTSGCLIYSSTPTITDKLDLESVITKFTERTTSAFLFKRKSLTSLISTISYASSLVLSVVIIIFCAIRINLKFQSSKTTSQNLMARQRKMNQILLTQFICPLIFIQLPFIYSVFGPIVGLSQGIITDLLPLLFMWSLVANTIVFFVLSTEVKRFVIRKRTIVVSSDSRRI